MTDLQIRTITFTAAVLRRPQMYTMNGTFVEVVSYLEGYYSGAARSNIDLAPVVEWSAFREWLAARLEVDSVEAFKRIEQSSDDDCQRLKVLADWYGRFQAEP